jgi:hypothetical protein
LPFGFIDRQPQPWIGIQIAAAHLGGNRDLANKLGKKLAAFLVLGALAVLNIRPLTVSCLFPRTALKKNLSYVSFRR